MGNDKIKEADWIRWYRSVEPLVEKLHDISPKDRQSFKRKEYGQTIEEIKYYIEYRNSIKGKESRRKAYKNRYDYLKSQGLCVKCGKELALQNHVSCKSCLDKYKEYNKKYRLRNK